MYVLDSLNPPLPDCTFDRPQSEPQYTLTMAMTWPTKKLTWLVTGASSGFGLQLTRLALSHGHHVIATARNPSSNPSLTTEITSQGSRFLPLNVDAPESAQDLITDLEKDGVEIDVLVNCAGYSVHGPVESFTEEEVKAQMETVFFGPYRLIRAVMPGMRMRRRGIVVALGSGAGVDGRPSMGIYGAAKAALDGKFAGQTQFCSPSLSDMSQDFCALLRKNLRHSTFVPS